MHRSIQCQGVRPRNSEMVSSASLPIQWPPGSGRCLTETRPNQLAKDIIHEANCYCPMFVRIAKPIPREAPAGSSSHTECLRPNAKKEVMVVGIVNHSIVIT